MFPKEERDTYGAIVTRFTLRNDSSAHSGSPRGFFRRYSDLGCFCSNLALHFST